MTDYPYLPFLLAKRIFSCIECNGFAKETLGTFRDCLVGNACEGLDDQDIIQKLTQVLTGSSHFPTRIADVTAVKAELGDAYYVPWYLTCVPDKFPAWFGKVDDRLLRAAAVSSNV